MVLRVPFKVFGFMQIALVSVCVMSRLVHDTLGVFYVRGTYAEACYVLYVIPEYIYMYR